MTGVKFCSPECAKMQKQREYRRRQKQGGQVVNGRMTGHGFQRTWETKSGDTKSSWAYAIERGRRDGKRLTPLTRGPYRTKQDAQTALRDELEQREHGTWVEASRQTVGEWFTNEWVPSLAQLRLRATTRDLYRNVVRLHIAPKPFGDLPIQTLRPKDVRDLFARLETEGSPGGRGPLSSGSLHNVRTVLHKGLKQAAAEQIVARNVCALVDPPARTPVDDDEPEHWTTEQLAQFLDYVDRATLEGAVTERRTRVMVAGSPVGSKTKRGRQVIRLDAAVVDVLKSWRSEQNRLRLRYGADWQGDAGHVFTHEARFTKPVRYGVPVRPDWVSAKFRRYARGAALPALRLHGLRHSYVTTAAENGTGTRDIADSVGHADPSITERYYRSTFERVQEVALASTASAINRARAAGR